MAVEDWASNERWLIAFDEGANSWFVSPNDECWPSFLEEKTYLTFAEAHAAYLDAVTCPVILHIARTDWRSRCKRSRNHVGRCSWSAVDA